jgi:hypothetical protein
MEPEVSLPYSQVPATCPYPEPTLPTTPSNFLKIHLNIILPSTSGSPQCSLSLWLPHQHPVHTSLLPHTRHMPRPSHSSRKSWKVSVQNLKISMKRSNQRSKTVGSCMFCMLVCSLVDVRPSVELCGWLANGLVEWSWQGREEVPVKVPLYPPPSRNQTRIPAVWSRLLRLCLSCGIPHVCGINLCLGV